MTDHDLLLGKLCSQYGLRPREVWGDDLDRALAKISRRLGLSDGETANRAFDDPVLQRELAGCLTVSESFFHRHPEHFNLIVEHIEGRLSGLHPGDALTVWSAGCCRGEEPFSAAIALRDQFGAGAEKVRIVASDVDAEAISAAAQGLFNGWSLRGLSARVAERYFTPVSAGRWQVCAEVRAMVSFSQMAALEHMCVLASNSVDVVLFRNVAIYLEPPALEQVYEGFARVLRSDGLLLVGPSDPRPPKPLFASRGHASGCAYWKRASPLRQGASSEPRVTRPRPPGAPPATARPTRPTCAQALTLADRGRIEDALAMATRIVADSPTDKAAYFARGKIWLSATRNDKAVEDLRRALFIGPDDRVVRYWYAHALLLAGRPLRSLSQIRDLSTRLRAVAEYEVLEDGQTTAGELQRAASLLGESIV